MTTRAQMSVGRKPSSDIRYPSSDIRCPLSAIPLPFAVCRKPLSACRKPKAESRTPNAECQTPNAECQTPLFRVPLQLRPRLRGGGHIFWVQRGSGLEGRLMCVFPAWRDERHSAECLVSTHQLFFEPAFDLWPAVGLRNGLTAARPQVGPD